MGFDSCLVTAFIMTDLFSLIHFCLSFTSKRARKIVVLCYFEFKFQVIKTLAKKPDVVSEPYFPKSIRSTVQKCSLLSIYNKLNTDIPGARV